MNDYLKIYIDLLIDSHEKEAQIVQCLPLQLT